VDVAPSEDLKDGEGDVYSLESGPILIFKKEGELNAFSAICTHLSCPVKWREETSDIYCACHGAICNPQGEKVKGPDAAPLQKVPVKEIGGRMIVEIG
jgi:cytochrome b6-f complex iron-sulfur subunit